MAYSMAHWMSLVDAKLVLYLFQELRHFLPLIPVSALIHGPRMYIKLILICMMNT